MRLIQGSNDMYPINSSFHSNLGIIHRLSLKRVKQLLINYHQSRSSSTNATIRKGGMIGLKTSCCLPFPSGTVPRPVRNDWPGLFQNRIRCENMDFCEQLLFNNEENFNLRVKISLGEVLDIAY